MDLVDAVTPEERATITGPPPDPRLVSTIWASEGIHAPWKALPATGVANFIYATDDFVLRVATLHPDGVRDARTESVAAPVALAAGIRTPRLLAFDDSRELVDRPYSLWDRMHLETLGVLKDEAASERGWRGVGEQLAGLHQRVTSCPDPKGWLDRPGYDNPREALERAAASGAISRAEGNRLQAWIGRLEERISPAAPDRFLHGDLYDMNVMCRVDGSNATMIDWGDAGWGEPAFDFTDTPPRYLLAALEGYASAGGSRPGAGLEGRILWIKLGRILHRATRRGGHKPYLDALIDFAESAPGAWREFQPAR